MSKCIKIHLSNAHTTVPCTISKEHKVNVMGLHKVQTRTIMSEIINKKLSYRSDSARCHSRSLEVIGSCANRRGMYEFLLALSSNLTSIFNRSRDITLGLYLSIPHVSSRWNWKKTARGRWTRFGVRVTRTLGYPTTNLNLRKNAPCDHNTRLS